MEIIEKKIIKNFTILFIVISIIIFILDYFLKNTINFYFPLYNLIFINLILLIFVIYCYGNKILIIFNKLSINNKTYYILLFILILYFILIKYSELNNIKIGTDESNTLYVIKLIQEGLFLFKDFWYREPLSVFVYKPFLNIASDPFVSLRLFVYFIHTITLISIFFISKKLSNLKGAFFILSIIIIFNQIFFKSYLGLFNILWFFLQIIIIFLLLISTKIKRRNALFWLVLGVIEGISIFIYKGSLLFLLITPIIIISFNKKYLKYLFYNMLGNIYVLLIFWVYFGLNSSFLIIYEVALKTIIITSLTVVTGIIIWVLLNKIKSFRFLKNSDIIQLAILSSLFLFFILFIYNYFIGSGKIEFWPFLLESSFIFLLFAYYNFLYLKNISQILLKIFITLLSIFFVIIFVSDYANNGSFVNIAAYIHSMIFYGILMFYIILLLSFIDKNEIKFRKKDKIILLITNLFFLATLTGLNFMPSRSKYVIFISIFIVCSLFNLLKQQNKKIIKYIFLFIFIYLLGTADYINKNFKSSYTMYDHIDVKNLINKIDTSENCKMFTGDLAISILSNCENMYKSGSPWTYRRVNKKQNHPFYYSGKFKKDNSYIFYNKSDYAKHLENQKPRYILGTWRGTFKTFFDIGHDKENTELKQVLDKDYEFKFKYKNFTVYELKN